MWKSGVLFGIILLSCQASALTFKSGQSLSGAEQSGPAIITKEQIASCQKENGISTSSDSWQAMSFNIRYDNSGDGGNAWPKRTHKVAQIFSDHNVDLGGLQEVLDNQFTWLQQNLTDYEFVGVGRDDGKTKGEYAPIFFRKSKFDMLSFDTVWLSETPDVPGSKGWDAALPRIVTFATLRDKASDKIVLLGSAHYDHRGTQAKLNSGKVIQEYVSKKIASLNNPIVILAGDFNDTSNTGTTRAIENENCLLDSYRVTKDKSGPNSTWNGFRSVAAFERIDYVFTNQTLPILAHVIDDRRIDGGFPSDHLPVIVKLAAPK